MANKDLKIRFLRANETFDIKGDVVIDFSGFDLGLLIGLKLLCQNIYSSRGLKLDFCKLVAYV